MSVDSKASNQTVNRLTQRQFTYSASLQRMLNQLPLQTSKSGNTYPLTALTTRVKQDPAIALLDVWATSLEILGFYQQRYSQEVYLKTAVENLSVREMGRSVGFEVKPGLAASTYLVFTVSTEANNTGSAKVPKATKLQSVPVQDALPQTFETTIELTAKAEWNSWIPYIPLQQIKQNLTATSQTIKIQGTTTELQVGDAILIVGTKTSNGTTSTERLFRTLTSVNADAVQDYTLIKWDTAIGHALSNLTVSVFRSKSGCFGHDATPFNMLKSLNLTNNWDMNNPTVWQDSAKKVYTNADLYLSQSVSGIVNGSWIYLQDGANKTLYQVASTISASLADFGRSDNVTGLTLKNSDGTKNIDNTNKTDAPDTFKFRTTTIYAKSEPLTLFVESKSSTTEKAIDAAKRTIKLASKVNGLTNGKPLMLVGKQIGATSNTAEVVTVTSAITDATTNRTTINLKSSPTKTYQESTVTIYGNVVHATHGETVSEVLGSGDGSKTNQSFVLSNSPLTYLSSTSSSGLQSTLEIRVNDVLWKQVNYLRGLPANSQSYIVRHHEDKVQIIFGDGIQGARLPSGEENVKATYRIGIGSSGNVAANSITLLQDSPLGIEAVNNPSAASGGVDAESLNSARTNAPLVALTLGRLISVNDFENYVRTFAGISKAQAKRIRQKRLLHITVAGLVSGTVNTTVITNLKKAMALIRNSGRKIEVSSYKELKFNVTAKIKVDTRFNSELVVANIKIQLAQAFAFSKRTLGDSIKASNITDVIQKVAGVLYVDLDELYIVGKTVKLNAVLQAQQAKLVNITPVDKTAPDYKITPAELLLINTATITLK